MAFLTFTPAVSLRSHLYRASCSPRCRPMLVKATLRPTSDSASPRPILSTWLRLASSAAVLLAATSPALAWVPFVGTPPPPPTPLTATASPEFPMPDGGKPTFEMLILLITMFTSLGQADYARSLLSLLSCCGGESCAPLFAAQALFVDGKVDEAISALQELARKYPRDYRPLFCQVALYFSLGRSEEFLPMLERCRQVAGDKLDPVYGEYFFEIEERVVQEKGRQARQRRGPNKVRML